MADRSHLSIGEVLSLLQDEFPDLTITKIRFLEGQGLIAPERTPSGYRKFYEPDIERLRWILFQQREHFLPLKVIKDRLDEFGGAVPPLDDRVPVPGSPPQLPLEAGDGRPEPVWMADHARATAGAASGELEALPEELPRPTAGPEALPEPIPAAPQPRAQAHEATAPGPSKPVQHAAPAPSAGPPPAPKAQPPKAPAAKAPAAKAPPAAPQSQAPSAAPPPAQASAPRPPASSAPAGPPRGRSAAAEAVPDPKVEPLDSGPSGLSLSLDELMAATGLDASQVRALEQFGLLESQQVGPDTVYADEAVVVARKATVFFRHGVEARHLRAYKVAADREAGLLEQIILPLLKQRNPESRRQAVSVLGELAEQGQALHAAFLRQALREHLGPRR